MQKSYVNDLVSPSLSLAQPQENEKKNYLLLKFISRNAKRFSETAKYPTRNWANKKILIIRIGKQPGNYDNLPLAVKCTPRSPRGQGLRELAESSWSAPLFICGGASELQ